MRFQRTRKCAAILCIFILCSCATIFNEPNSKNSKIQNVILLIGDGMGPQQLGFLLQYGRYSKNLDQNRLNIERIIDSGEFGFVQPSSYNSLVADSACSATALASGLEVYPQTLGLDARGKKVPTILELAKANGKSAGLVSDTRATHATPAAFAAHVTDRNSENEIAVQMLESGVDVLLSGGLRHWLPQREAVSARKDTRNLIKEAQNVGYHVVLNRFDLEKARLPKILGLFSLSAMPNGIKENLDLKNANREIPTLAEMTKSALRALEQNPQGFFLMVEAGQIDWAGHANDAGQLLHEMLRFDRALGAILDWLEGRDDTLLVITADHETGGFGFSYSGYQIPKPKDLGDYSKELYSPQYNFIEPSTLDRIYDQRLSLIDIMKTYEQRPKTRKIPEALKILIEKNTEFEISLQQAQEILELKPNRFYREGHDKLRHKLFPYIHDFGAFYTEFDLAHTALIARALANDEGVVWASGTHTSTPVPVIAVGPKSATNAFNGFQQQTRIGSLLRKAMLGK